MKQTRLKKAKRKQLTKKRFFIISFSTFAFVFTASLTYVTLSHHANQKVLADQTVAPTFYCLGNNSCDKLSYTPTPTFTDQHKQELQLARQKQLVDLARHIATPSSGINTCQKRTTRRARYNRFFTYILTLLCKYFNVACSQITTTTTTTSGTNCITPSVTPLMTQAVVSPTLAMAYPTTTPLLTTTPTITTMPVLTTAPSATPTLSPTIPPSPTPTPTTPATGQTISPTAQNGGNYSGYAYSIAQPAVNDTVTLTWTAVQMTCGRGLVSPWVGMGDLPATEHNLAQLGVDYDCTGGSPAYATWTEALPADSVYYNNDTVKQGDTLVSSVTYQGNGTFLTKLSDTQQGWSISLPMQYANNYVAQGGEAIFEEVGGQGVQQFAPQDFTNFTFGNGSTTNLQPVSSAQGIIRYDMTHAASSALNGSSFTMTYR